MILGLTMRMFVRNYPGGQTELRDALACDWPVFLEKAMPGVAYVLLPNLESAILTYVERLGVDSLLFTGGEDWGVFPQRDATEAALFAWALEKRHPVLGVCRGAQVINRLLGGKSGKCQGHVAVRHGIVFQDNIFAKKKRIDVNSFHNICIAESQLALELASFGLACDGSVEAFMGRSKPVCGIVWHPEREVEPCSVDVELFRKFYGGELHG